MRTGICLTTAGCAQVPCARFRAKSERLSGAIRNAISAAPTLPEILRLSVDRTVGASGLYAP